MNEKTNSPNKTARCWCKRAVEVGVTKIASIRARYRLRPWVGSSSASSVVQIMG